MREEITKHLRFKQNNEDKVCSIIHNGEYIFSPEEAQKVAPETVEEYSIRSIYYSNAEEMKEAMLLMPDYELWDSEKKVFKK